MPVTAYRDLFGNWCGRVVVPSVAQTPVDLLPESTLLYLLGSRCCETDPLSSIAWQRFGDGPTGWFEAFPGDRWYTFDARNNAPRIGRVLIARGRDACDVALSNTFGPNTLEGFRVWADEVV